MFPLYAPTLIEIDRIVQAGSRKEPKLAKPLERAGVILGRGDLVYTSGEGWSCNSQGRPQNGPYPLSGNHCTCPSFAAGDYVITGSNGRIYVHCKHRLAFLAYRDILLAHLHERLVGDARYGHEREHARAEPHCRLILESSGREPIVSAYMERGRAPYPICWVRRVKRGVPTKPCTFYCQAIARGVPPDEAALMADAAIAKNPAALESLYKPI